MQYPLISEYKEAILNADDNFDKLAYLQPVCDVNGEPIISSGNFAVVFKMTDGQKFYAIKCFLREQEGRADAYKHICEYLSEVQSKYFVQTEYLENELFVDTDQSTDTEFPVLKMEWVEGVSLDYYIKYIKEDENKRLRLADEFRELTFWLMEHNFAHGDLKPDNIIVTKSEHLVLVDYDGMFVPSMSGQKSRELGTPLFRFKGRKSEDFNEFTDDYACVFIMLVLMVNSLTPIDFDFFTSPDTKDILQQFSVFLEHPQVAPYIAAFLLVASSGRLDRQIFYQLLSHRLQKSRISQNIFNSLPRTFTVNGINFKMMPVEGGTFTMGATIEQGDDASENEKPAHKVTLSNYAIGVHEVTQELWDAIMCKNPSEFKGANLPVENVSWYDCQKFIQRLNNLLHMNFRLPTEAEWEFAARGGNMSEGYKYSGGNVLDDVAWYSNNSGRKTHPVGTKHPNELGIYDMSGNVMEWCNDWLGNYSSLSMFNPTGPSSGISPVFRGGGYYTHAKCCRVTHRGGNGANFHFTMGFRLAFPLENVRTKIMILTEEQLSHVDRWYLYKRSGIWILKAILIRDRIIDDTFLIELANSGIQVDNLSLFIMEMLGLTQCDSFFINKNAIEILSKTSARIIANSFPFEIRNINWNISYVNKWRTKHVRSLDKDEQDFIKRTEIVMSQYGKSVCFYRNDNGKTYIPLSDQSPLKVGESINLSKAKLITLCRNGDNDIYRVFDL